MYTLFVVVLSFGFIYAYPALDFLSCTQF